MCGGLLALAGAYFALLSFFISGRALTLARHFRYIGNECPLLNVSQYQSVASPQMHWCMSLQTGYGRLDLR